MSSQSTVSDRSPQTTRDAEVARGLRIADAARRRRHVFIHDLTLRAALGVHDHEKGVLQPVRVNVDLTVREGDKPLVDSLENVVCYETITDRIKAVVHARHLNLVETLAEEIAATCLEDKRVEVARIRIEKLAAIAEAVSVGVEIERTRQDSA